MNMLRGTDFVCIVRYEHLKNMRNLLWHYELGSVTIQLTFDNGDFEFRCLPVHAALLEHFDESSMSTIHISRTWTEPDDLERLTC